MDPPTQQDADEIALQLDLVQIGLDRQMLQYDDLDESQEELVTLIKVN